MTLFAFKLVDRNLYVLPDATIVDPFSSHVLDTEILHKKRKIFEAAMKHVADNKMPATSVCRIIKSESCSIRGDKLYRRVHVFLVMEEKEASLFRLFFPDLKWEKWTPQRVDYTKPRRMAS